MALSTPQVPGRPNWRCVVSLRNDIISMNYVRHSPCTSVKVHRQGFLLISHCEDLVLIWLSPPIVSVGIGRKIITLEQGRQICQVFPHIVQARPCGDGATNCRSHAGPSIQSTIQKYSAIRWRIGGFFSGCISWELRLQTGKTLLYNVGFHLSLCFCNQIIVFSEVCCGIHKVDMIRHWDE